MGVFENIAEVLKSEDVKEYGSKSIVDLGKLILNQDVEAGINLAVNTQEFLLSVPNLIFFSKLKRFISGTYFSFEDQVKMASKFDDDYKGYVQFVKRQIYILNEIEEEEKIDYYSNLTRACLLEQIDIPLYFKLAHILKYYTSEELVYLEKNINKPITKLNVFIDSFLGNGLVKMTLASTSGNNEYTYTDLAKKLVNYAILFSSEMNQYITPQEKETLDSVAVIEPRTSSPFNARANGNLGITPGSLEAFTKNNRDV